MSEVGEDGFWVLSAGRISKIRFTEMKSLLIIRAIFGGCRRGNAAALPLLNTEPGLLQPTQCSAATTAETVPDPGKSQKRSCCHIKAALPTLSCSQPLLKSFSRVSVLSPVHKELCFSAWKPRHEVP